MPPPQGGMGWRGQPYAVNGPQPTMQFQTEIMLLQGDERIRAHAARQRRARRLQARPPRRVPPLVPPSAQALGPRQA